MPPDRFGLSCALATPFDAGGAVDHARLVSHVRRCLAAGCGSVTVFGTTGEGSSLGLSASLVTRNQALGGAGGIGGGPGDGVYSLGHFTFEGVTLIIGNHASTSHADIFSV